MKEDTKNRIVVWLVPILLAISMIAIVYFVMTSFAWNIEGGIFVRAECNPERQSNVTWIQLEDEVLVYCTYNPEVLDCIPGKYYWFGEGLISGNYGKTLLWVTDENPVTNASESD